ncbi:MAG: hypothetical protein XE08_0216 [Parcubacteria bacterium 32_520]|nr:MAG: hypothetical protein XE08_0216 [Parcubacteria bacterium 32_520]
MSKNNLKKLNDAFIKNAVKEMREIEKKVNEYAVLLENTTLDVEQEAIIDNFSHEFNHEFSQVVIKA